jgi:hypothetical protein
MSEPSDTKDSNSKALMNKPVIKNAEVDSNKASYASYIIMLVCVLASASVLIYYFTKVEKPATSTNQNGAAPLAGNLTDGKEYIFYLRSVEVQPKQTNGKAWDSGNSAPDVFYRVLWQGNQIYESETMNDSLIADWIPVGLSLKESILSGNVSVDQAIKLPKVKYDSQLKESDEVMIKIFDNDLLSGNDPIQDIALSLGKLQLGDNTIYFNDKPERNLIKAVVRVIDNQLSTDEKIQAIMRSK